MTRGSTPSTHYVEYGLVLASETRPLFGRRRSSSLTALSKTGRPGGCLAVCCLAIWWGDGAACLGPWFIEPHHPTGWCLCV